jgi:hypothetical protein
MLLTFDKGGLGRIKNAERPGRILKALSPGFRLL